VAHKACIWLLDATSVTDGRLARFADWLDDSERRRLARFIRPARRRQFLAGRALARLALGDTLALAPQDVRLVERPGAAPSLVLPGGGNAGFSISHSGPWVGCAVSKTSRIGFDLELIDPARDIDALAAQAFDHEQLRWLAARPPASRVHDFYRSWSEAEARCKLGMTPHSLYHLPHASLSMALCCEHVLVAPPERRDLSLF